MKGLAKEEKKELVLTAFLFVLYQKIFGYHKKRTRGFRKQKQHKETGKKIVRKAKTEPNKRAKRMQKTKRK